MLGMAFQKREDLRRPICAALQRMCLQTRQSLRVSLDSCLTAVVAWHAAAGCRGMLLLLPWYAANKCKLAGQAGCQTSCLTATDV